MATEGEGYGDLVEGLGAGVSVKGDEASAIGGAILRLLGDPVSAAAMGQLGHVAVARFHTWDQRAKELETVCARPAAAIRSLAC